MSEETENEITERYSIEKLFQVWDNKTGERFEMGMDRDCLYLLEFRTYSKEGEIQDRYTLPTKVGRLLSDALPEILNYIQEEERIDDSKRAADIAMQRAGGVPLDEGVLDTIESHMK